MTPFVHVGEVKWNAVGRRSGDQVWRWEMFVARAEKAGRARHTGDIAYESREWRDMYVGPGGSHRLWIEADKGDRKWSRAVISELSGKVTHELPNWYDAVSLLHGLGAEPMELGAGR